MDFSYKVMMTAVMLLAPYGQGSAPQLFTAALMVRPAPKQRCLALLLLLLLLLPPPLFSSSS